MFYFSLFIFLICAWTLPWWGIAAVAFILGLIMPGKFKRAWEVSFAAGVAASVLAYVLDGRSHGLISQRMSGLFGLPFAPAIFLVMGILTGITVFLYYQAGVFLGQATLGRRQKLSK